MTDVDLTTGLADLTLPNPVMTASGCAGAGRELAPFLDVAGLGAFVTRSVTLDARAGRAMPRMVETPSGVLSAVGLQGPGIDGFLARDLPWLVQQGARAVVSIAGSSLGEYGELARRVGSSPGVAAVEVSLSAADVDAGLRPTACDPYRTGKVVSVVRRDLPRGVPVLVKLSPDLSSIDDVAKAAVDAGADGLVLVNGVPGLAIDPVTLRPWPGGADAGAGDAAGGALSGPAIRPVALRCVWQVHQAMPEVPLVGVGGIRTGFDALEFLLAGASAVQVGTAVFSDPSAPQRVLDELRHELADRHIPSVSAVVGRGHRPTGEQP